MKKQFKQLDEGTLNYILGFFLTHDGDNRDECTFTYRGKTYTITHTWIPKEQWNNDGYTDGMEMNNVELHPALNEYYNSSLIDYWQILYDKKIEELYHFPQKYPPEQLKKNYLNSRDIIKQTKPYYMALRSIILHIINTIGDKIVWVEDLPYINGITFDEYMIKNYNLKPKP